MSVRFASFRPRLEAYIGASRRRAGVRMLPTAATVTAEGPIVVRGRDVAIARFVVKEVQGRTFVAFAKDAGRTFGPPIRLDAIEATE
jgi:hypothetical protein